MIMGNVHGFEAAHVGPGFGNGWCWRVYGRVTSTVVQLSQGNLYFMGEVRQGPSQAKASLKLGRQAV